MLKTARVGKFGAVVRLAKRLGGVKLNVSSVGIAIFTEKVLVFGGLLVVVE